MANGWEESSEKLDGRTITISRRKKENLPLVVITSYREASAHILESSVRHNSPAYQLVSVSDIAWDEMLSPWPAEPVVTPEDHFTGQAKEYSGWLDDVLLPFVAERIPPVCSRIIAGYSMAGLFAVYAPYVSMSWDKCMCASGSLWFPGFKKFAVTTAFEKKPECIYMSIGNQETVSNIPALTTTQNVMEDLVAFYRSAGIDSEFELNPGNHYQDAAARIAKGIAWTIRDRRCSN